MDARFLAQLQTAYTQSQAILGDTFTYQSVAYPCIASDVDIFTELQEGGLMEVLATKIVFPLATLNTAPVSGQTLTLNGKLMRISHVASDEITWELTCVTAKK